MRAVVWSGPFDLALKEVPVPTPKSGEVLVKTEVVGICGSDIEIYNGRFKQSVPPMIIGHEGGGYVQAVGEGVRSVKPGDRVIVECVLSCGRCEYCKQGRFGLCESGGVLGMVGAQGEYAEYFVAPEKNCHRLPDEISWPEAGLIDTLAGPEYAVSRLLATGYAGRSGDEPGCPATWAVFGPGPAGLFSVLSQRYGGRAGYSSLERGTTASSTARSSGPTCSCTQARRTRSTSSGREQGVKALRS
jgi:L-iditol 2-dehydrogenase